MRALQIVTLLVSAASGRSEKFDIDGRPTCRSDSPSPSTWIDILRQATYQSVVRHLDYAGTLDGRLDRDHALWKRLQRARYVGDPGVAEGDAATAVRTGSLIQRPDAERIDFEFRQKDKSTFECSRNQCGHINGSVIALWRVRSVVNPHELWITVKVPNVRDSTVEDVYKYSMKFGLQKLNPDPLQLKSIKSENDHRFSIASKTNNERKLMPRMDFLFPGQSKSESFGGRRLAPPFAFDSPTLSGRSADGWMFAARKPRPGVVVDAGSRSHRRGPLFDPLSGPYIALGPQGYRHVIYSLPPIAPPQKLDSQGVRGFLPSVGPIIAPPPFKPESSFSPPYSQYYDEPPARYITPSPKHFHPSKEFVRYSELDPLYHSEGESELLHTSPMPDHDILKTTIIFPGSVNDDVLSTNSPLLPTNPHTHIVVKDFDTTTQKPHTTNRASKIQKHKTRLSVKPTSVSNTTADDKTLAKAFGEKIKPKNLTTIIKPRLRTDGKLKYTKKSTILSTRNGLSNNTITDYSKDDNIVSTLPTDVLNKSYTTIVANIDVANRDKHLNKNTTPTLSEASVESTETTEPIIDVFTEFTTEEINKQTTYLDFETTTESNEYEDNISTIKAEEPTKERKVIETTLKTKKTMVVGIKPTKSKEAATQQSKTVNSLKNSSDLYDDYYIDETTDSPVDSTTAETYDPDTTTKSTETELFSTLTDALFAIEASTQTTNKTTTITARERSNPHDADAETQESQQQGIQYRLLTFPGDSVSIVANRISKSVSYRTADGKEGQLQHKSPNSSVDRNRSDYYKDYSTIM